MIRVACAVVFYENKILVTQRGAEMNQPFKWEFPGGKTEQHETDEECIERELFEELNIKINISDKLKECFYDYGDFQISLVPFVADFVSGIITLREHMNYSWISPDQLLALDWSPADVEVAKEVFEIFH